MILYDLSIYVLIVFIIYYKLIKKYKIEILYNILS